MTGLFLILGFACIMQRICNNTQDGIFKDFLFSEKRSSYSSLSALNLVCNHYFNVKCSLVFARACIHTLVDHFGLGYLPERLRTWATLKTLIKEIKDFKKFQEESGIVPSTNSNTDGYQCVFFPPLNSLINIIVLSG